MDKPKKFYKGPSNIVYKIDDAVCGTNEALIEALQTSIRSKLAQDALVIPRLPQVAGRILQLTQSGDDVDISEAASVIKTDPALAARVLSNANSAAFAGTARVNGIDSAILRLGIKSVCNIVFTESLQTKLFSSRTYRDLVEDSWRASLGAAVACETLSRATGIETEGAFLLGLLHDTGTPTLVGAVSEYERKNNGQSLGLEVVEILHSQLHEEIGAHVLEKWGMPKDFVEAAGEHHRYRGATSAEARKMIYAAQLICTNFGLGGIQREITFNVEHVFTDLKLTDTDQIVQVVAAFLHDVKALFGGLGIAMPSVEYGDDAPPEATPKRAA